MAITSEQIKDTRNYLVQEGYDPDDFEFLDSDTTDWSTHPGPRPLSGELIIKRISTNKQKIYDSSSGSNWFPEFENDLQSGYYDT